MPGLGDALGYVAGSLDKPGRAVRGILGGKPREALAAIPFSDTLGITDPRDRVSGRNLTDAIGLTRSGDNSFGSHALGFGAEMALDPMAVLPVGKAIHALHGAGHFDSLGSALGRFGAEELGAARIPKPKLPTYDLAPMEKAQNARQSFKAPKGLAVDRPVGGGKYNMKPGPAPATKPPAFLAHEIDPAVSEVATHPLDHGGDYVTMTAAPRHGAPAEYASGDDMLDAYYRRQAEREAAMSPASAETYASMPSEGDMRFADDLQQTARQGLAAQIIGQVPEASRTPSLMQRLRQILDPREIAYGG